MNAPVPAAARLWQLALGFTHTSVLHALVETGVIEELGEQPKRLEPLAAACRLDPDVLRRTLRFAAAIDIVALVDEQYSLTETGRLLLKGVPGSLHMALRLAGSQPWQYAWQNLSHALVTGKEAFSPVMGAGFFEYLQQHPRYGEPYDQWMTLSTAMAAQAIVAACDFSPFRTVCDVGGGQGVLLRTILAAHEHLHGILYDQEDVVRRHVLAEMAGRVEIQAGSFFERVPAADALVLKSVLHDWDDEHCRRILGCCREAMAPSSRLLIVELVIASPADFMGAFYDLHMQVLLGGRERTENEFRELLRSVGLSLNRILPTRSPLQVLEVSR